MAGADELTAVRSFPDSALVAFVLPGRAVFSSSESLAGDPDRIARFQRGAKLRPTEAGPTSVSPSSLAAGKLRKAYSSRF